MNLKTIAQQIFHRTLAAIEVESVVRASLQLSGSRLTIGETECDLTSISRITVIAIGKASVAMARAVESILNQTTKHLDRIDRMESESRPDLIDHPVHLVNPVHSFCPKVECFDSGERIIDGLIVTNAVTGAVPQRWQVMIGGHPIPNEQSIAAAEAALALLRENDSEQTLVIFLISGGGSALFEKPIDDSLTLADLQEVNRVLVGCGAVIGEMNVVRRHLSAVKGGRLADAAPRSRQVSLYISDVNHDDLATIASGPTIASRATLADFENILARYELPGKFPPKVTRLIEAANAWSSGFSRGLLLPEEQSPPEGETTSTIRSHHLLLDNQRALLAARRIAENDFGCIVEIADDLIEGEIETMVHAHLERLAAVRFRHPGKTVCLLSGGEVICPVRGSGQGGRNQEFVLRAARLLDRQKPGNVVVLSAGTDGIDGHSPAAGAMADAETMCRAMTRGLSPEAYLHNSDSFNFFKALNDVIITGPTGNNVRDLRILLAR